VDLSSGVAEFTLEVGAGVLPIRVEARAGRAPLITMTQARPSFGARIAPAMVAEMFGLAAEEIVGSPRIVSTGTPFCVAVLRDHAALKRAVLDGARQKAFEQIHATPEAPFMEPYLVTLSGATAEGDTFSRLLLPPPMPPEDPFTGAATGCAAAYLWAEGLLQSPRYVAEQGHWMGRPGRAEVEVLGPRDAIEGVRVGGAGAVLMRGEIAF
jgi:PhzF family phenazine biosynthesis protein